MPSYIHYPANTKRWLTLVLPVLLFLVTFSGCTYYKSFHYAYDANHKKTATGPDATGLGLRWISVGRKTPTYWIPPLAIASWDKGKFRISFTFTGESGQDPGSQVTLEEVKLYEVVGMFANDTTTLFAARGNQAFTKEITDYGVQFTTAYFLKIKKPKQHNLRLKLTYSLTSNTGKTEHFTLHTPLRNKTVSEYSILGLVIENKHKPK